MTETLIARIKADQVNARRLAVGFPHASLPRLKVGLLTALLGESMKVGKDAGREPSDQEVTSVIRKFVKNIDEILKVRPDDANAKTERTLLEAYLPVPLADDEIRAYLREAFTPDALTMKNMKPILEALSARYPGRVSGAQVAAILKDQPIC